MSDNQQIVVDTASFRDPSGYVVRAEGVVLRAVLNGGMGEYRMLMESGLYQRLTDKGLLVPHQELDEHPLVDERIAAVLKPDEVPFLSYPYEWCFDQLRAAALLTLRIQRIAVGQGMSLKDATAFNVQFWGTQPKFIDTLSLETYEEGRPWVAYGQFCRHFLAPLLVASATSSPLEPLLGKSIEGMALPLASRLLPRRTLLSPGIATHLHLHAKLETRHGNDAQSTRKPPRVSKAGLLGLIASLESLVRKLKPPKNVDVWNSYYETNTYDEEATQQKLKLISQVTAEQRPRSAWDLGCNTGMFTDAMAELGTQVVAMDSDAGVIGELHRKAVAARSDRVLPLVMDLSNPSPALGWAHQERRSLLDRGPSDLCLGLALIHHLSISNNVPMGMIADFFSRCSRTCVVEWVPETDPQVVRMLASGRLLPADYNRNAFVAAFDRVFSTATSLTLPTGRELFTFSR